MEDSMIIELFNERNEKAITESDLKYGKYCKTIAYNILADLESTEECVNDTWFRAWNCIPPEKPGVLKAFFAKITRNLAFDRYRKSKSKGNNMSVALDELSECIASDERVDEQVEFAELSRCIDVFLKQLSERDRTVFIGRYYFVYSISYISKALGIKENYIRNILSRTRTKLRDHLLKEGYFV